MFFVAIGGFFGAICRYIISNIFKRYTYPIATTVVNVIGSFLLGIVLTHLSGTPLLIIGIGFLGAFTTFSTFSVEVVRLIQQTQYAVAFMNMSVQIICSLIACYIGLHI